MRHSLSALAGGAALLAFLACNKEGQANMPVATPAPAPSAAAAAPAAPAANAPPANAPAANAAAPAAPAGEAAAAPAGEKQYAVEAPAVTLKVGATSDAKLTIKAGKGLHFNQEYPAKFAVTPAAFAKSTKEKLATKTGEVTFVGQDGLVTIPLQGLAVGAGKLEVVGSFSVCSDEQCYILRDEKLSLDVTVQ